MWKIITQGLYFYKYLCENAPKTCCLFIIFLTGKIAHIVTGSLTIYNVVHSSLGVILQTVQPYHHYNMCYITDRDHDLRKKLQLCTMQGTISINYIFELFLISINKHHFGCWPKETSVISPRGAIKWCISTSMWRTGYLQWGCDPISSKSTTPLEKRNAFTALIQVCGISDDYFGPFWWVINRGWNFQVQLMSSFMGIAC